MERLKGSSSINPSRVDDAISEMDEVSRARRLCDGTDVQAELLETSLSKRLNAISQHLHVAMRTHSRQAHEEVAVALLENARLSIGYHKHTLRELESLRPDIARIGTVGAPAAPATPVRAAPPPLPSQPAPQPPMMPNVAQNMGRGYTSPPRAPPSMDGSKSMFLPPPSQGPIQRPNSADPPGMRQDPLGGASMQGHPNHPNSSAPMYHGGGGYPQGPHGGRVLPSGQVPPGYPAQGGMMAQSMVLPGHHGGQAYPGQAGRAQTVGRAGARRLDERQAAKLLAGGF